MRKVLYFGSFNPVHYGHVSIARYVAAMEDVGAVVIIPSPHNPFKDTSILADPQLRLSQVLTAFEGLSPKISVSAIEYTLPEPRYTINTLKKIQQTCPNDELILLIGADNILGLEKWYHGKDILRDFEVWVYPATAMRVPKHAGNTPVQRKSKAYGISTKPPCSTFHPQRSATGQNKKAPHSEELTWRYQAESNCCTRFCRPLPNHSAMVPFLLGAQR